MDRRRVVITGLGVISPVGNSIDEFWSSLIAGKSGISRITQFDPAQYDSQIAGEVKGFEPSPHISPKDKRRMDKFVQYALVAAHRAVADAGIDFKKDDPYQTGVLIGSGIGSLYTVQEQTKVLMTKGPSKMSPFTIPMLIVNMASGWIAISFGVKGPNSAVATACASGGHAIGDAFKIIQRGAAQLMITGGTESCICQTGVGAFCAMKALSTKNNEPEKASRPFDKNRDGFVIGEGAGVVILENLEHAQKRNAPIYAEIIGYGMSGDAYHMTAPDPEGEGAARAMSEALGDARIRPEDISYINAHGTSTPLNDKVETLAIKKVFGKFAQKIPISSTKSMTGHLLGAAGGVEFVACCLSIKNNIIAPTINYETPDPDCDLDYVPNTAREAKVDIALSNSLGFGGHNATLLIRRFK
ncbi:MAG: beta-ketoacyl-ACP synthase II [Candidatus Omnitrophica bacterium]|nr:beta-ketoacyl-ACP synthase II [Candidatus Omnitrophota bacterium]MBU4140917.1 beta-ketoacyl-ACP synthase II [Candidatus Omnitrophota bacterium]